MSWFTDYRSHRFVGFLYGLTLRGRKDAAEAIQRLDRWGWDREWRQNLRGNRPNPALSARQLQEAMAWGAGARAASGVDVPYPSPPYPEGSTWVA